MNNPRFSVQPMAGRQLPPRWKAQAPQRALEASQNYANWLENAWRGGGSPGDATDPNIMRQSRLQPPEWKDIVGER